MNDQPKKNSYEVRQAWRQMQWERRNRSAAWLIEEALQLSESTTTGFIKPMRIARCGWTLGKPVVQLIDGKASIANLEHCASPWACPICAPIIRMKRGMDLQQAANRWQAEGHGLVFATLTRPHTRGERLEQGMDIITVSWSTMIASQRWRLFKKTYAVTHWARSIEITWNPSHGWHAHIHALLFIDRPNPHIKELQNNLYDLWNTMLRQQGSRKASKRHGVTLLPVKESPERVGRYMCKPPDAIGMEITRMDNKTSRKDSLAPFQLLDQSTIDDIGGSKAKHLWLEYAHATKGQRSITWSRELRSSLLSTPEQTDQQIIEDTISGIPVIDIHPDAYRQLKREPSVMAFILRLTETGEIPLALDMLNDTL